MCSIASISTRTAEGHDIPGGPRDITVTIESQLRKASLVPVISDFLFADAPRVIGELAHLNAVHDVFLVMADVRFAYELPAMSDGWIEAYDIETRRHARASRGASCAGSRRASSEWQDGIERQARDADLDVVRVGLDRWEMETALVEFAAERRLRKMMKSAGGDACAALAGSQVRVRRSL